MDNFLLDAVSDGSCQFFRKIVMESADAVVAVDREQKLVFFNPAAEQLFGYLNDEILGKPLDLLLPHRFRHNHAARVRDFHDMGSRARYMGDRKSHLHGMRADGSEVMLGATILSVSTDSGPVMVAILRDIGERIGFQNELARLASADPLTGQLNRRAFLDSFEREWRLAFRYKSRLSLMMFDLDYFKRINDTYGHDVGDQVICRFSQLVQSELRDVDIFGRWGGEEFVAAMPHTDMRTARSAAERIREAIAAQRFEAAGFEPFSVSVSIGVADIGDGDIPHQQMIKFADNALYEAKATGRNQVVIWNVLGGIRPLARGNGN